MTGDIASMEEETCELRTVSQGLPDFRLCMLLRKESSFDLAVELLFMPSCS